MGTVLIFRLSDRPCAVATERVLEIVPMASLARPPGLPALLEGFLNLRGTAVPVLRLHRLFDLPGAPMALYTPLLIVRDGPRPLGLLVDEVKQVIEVSPDALLPIKEGHIFNDCAEAEVVLGDGHPPAHLLSCERLVLEQERQCIAELQAAAQRRLEELEGPS